jgi:hypothetical protein
MLRHAYPSDLTDGEYITRLAHLPRPGRGRPWEHPPREVLDGIFYVVRTGCQWRALPHEYPAVADGLLVVQAIPPGWHPGSAQRGLA